MLTAGRSSRKLGPGLHASRQYPRGLFEDEIGDDCNQDGANHPRDDTA